MCYSIENHSISHRDNERLKYRAFYLRLSTSNEGSTLPETLTLLYLPRINGGLLEINDARIRPDSASFGELRRVSSAKKGNEAFFISTDRIRVSEGVRFEVYLKEDRVLKGIFKKDDREMWKMECQYVATDGDLGVSEVGMFVAGERSGLIMETVKMVARRRKKRFSGLEDIPEEREGESDGCDYQRQVSDMGSLNGGDSDEEWEEVDRTVEMEMEGVRWALDLGIWVMCLGVGILVSKASTKGLMRMRRRSPI